MNLKTNVSKTCFFSRYKLYYIFSFIKKCSYILCGFDCCIKIYLLQKISKYICSNIHNH